MKKAEAILVRLADAKGPSAELMRECAQICAVGGARFEKLLEAEAWLDAAALLVPKGWHWALKNEWAWRRRRKRATDRSWMKKFGYPSPYLGPMDLGEPCGEIYAPGYEKQPIGGHGYWQSWRSAYAAHPALALAILCIQARSPRPLPKA